jgi:hypothetical protein
MPAAVDVSLLVLFLGLLGAGARTLTGAAAHLDLDAERPGTPRFDDAFLFFLSGLVVASVILTVLAFLNAFSMGGIAGAGMLGIVATGLGLWKRRRLNRSHASNCVLGLLIIALAAVVANGIVPPYEARLNGSDASVYLGMASHIARTGGLGGEDPLVAAMSVEERQALFLNRFPGDATGQYARFPGGVRLVDPARTAVSFHFYHLWPVWLAFGETTVGSPESLAVLSMFVATSGLSLFLLGRTLAGNGFALAATALVFLSFPQVYYSRMPLSEMPAQAYFLAGLVCFLWAMAAAGGRREYLQLLAGGLWGCFCLIRVDGILFLIPALVCSFLLFRDLRRSFSEWLPLAIALMLFVSLAVLHHIAVGSYSIPADVPLLGGAVHFGAHGIMQAEPALVLAWLAVAAGMGLLWKTRRAPRLIFGLGMGAVALFLLITVIWLVAYSSRFEWRQVLRHIGWLSLYLPGPVMPAIAVGLVFLAIRLLREPSRTVPAFVCVMLMVPWASLLVSPMVTATQPWAIRRFVPMVLPLVLTLALLGWHYALLAAAAWLGASLNRGYALVAAGGGVCLLPLSAPLWGTPLYANLDYQVGSLADRIPADALVIVPDEDAGTHMQTSLQYGEGRSTLLLPLRVEPEAAASAAIDQFLARQLATGRRVIALVQYAARPPEPLASRFESTALFSHSISFVEVPQVAASEFAATPVSRQVRYYAFELHRASETPSGDGPGRLAAGIDLSAPVLPRDIAAMAGISHAEPEGRWTDGPVARLRFRRPLPARFTLELEIANVYPPNRGRRLRARVGSQIREARLPHERDTLRLAFVSSSPRDTIELRIPNPTSPASRAESSDGRRLGIRLKRFRIVGFPE